MHASVGALPAVGGDGSDGASIAPVLALDIGGTKLAAGVVDSSGRVRSFVVAPSNAADGPGPALARLFELGRRAVAESSLPWREILAVGIGCGGPLDAERGVLIAPPHLPGWHDVPVTALAEREYERPATLENDATAAAAGEHRWVKEEATVENLAARANWTPNPDDPTTFDYLLDSDFGSIDIVPAISGTYEELAPRAVNVQRGGNSVRVEAVSDLLATLTLPRREKDGDRVRQLRRIQRRQPS